MCIPRFSNQNMVFIRYSFSICRFRTHIWKFYECKARPFWYRLSKIRFNIYEIHCFDYQLYRAGFRHSGANRFWEHLRFCICNFQLFRCQKSIISLWMSKQINKFSCSSQNNKDCITLLYCNMAYIRTPHLWVPVPWPL